MTIIWISNLEDQVSLKIVKALIKQMKEQNNKYLRHEEFLLYQIVLNKKKIT